MSIEDGDKSTLYEETCRSNLYTRQTHPNSPDYSGKFFVQRKFFVFIILWRYCYIF